MSVLSFPRIYFKGYMQWNVDTANNNDYVPTYDATNAALDWDYLATQNPPITPENFATAFRPWVILPNSDACPAPPTTPPTPPTQDNCNDNLTCHMSSRWNYYGDQGTSFVQYGNYSSLTTGGVMPDGTQADPSDPILGQPLSISGGRLVDINPFSPFCSQIYFSSLNAGSSSTFIGGPQFQRMYSRSFMVPRNISPDLIIAGGIGVIFQTTIPAGSVTSGNGGSSPLLAALLQAIQANGAAGLMIRFSAYNTLYYQNGVFNNTPQQPKTCDELTQMYQNGEVFTNPAYSSIVGAIGVWNNGELSTAPGGRMLVPNASYPPPLPGSDAAKTAVAAAPASAARVRVTGHASVRITVPASPAASAQSTTPPPPPVNLGVIMAELNTSASPGVVSLDLMNATPEYTVDGAKLDFGPINVGVNMPDGSFQQIGSFGFDQYDQAAYEANGGIVDVPFDPGVTAQDVIQWADEGLLALQMQGSIASLEMPLTVQTDDRGVYVDECNSETITLQVLYKGAPAPPGTQVLLAQYFPWPLLIGSGLWVLFGTPPPPPPPPGQFCNAMPPPSYLSFLEGSTVTVSDNGLATFTIASLAPGFPIIAFYPFLDGSQPPAPQPMVTFGFSSYQTTSLCTAFFTAVRALPFDNALAVQFVDCWNGTGSYSGQPKYSADAAWQFVYTNILYLYDMLFPAMNAHIDLGSQQAVQSQIQPILQRISESMEDTNGYMPVTRDLSAAKRLILQTWGGLVEANFPQQDLPPIVVPCNM